MNIMKEKKKLIIEKAKTLDHKYLTISYIRNNPTLLGFTEHQIMELFGTWNNFRLAVGIKSYYKTENEVMDAVRKIAIKHNVPTMTKDFYLKYKESNDPSVGSQYRFMKKHNIPNYTLFIHYCINFEIAGSNSLIIGNKEKEEKEKQMVLSGLKNGYTENAIQVNTGLSRHAIKKYMAMENLSSEDTPKIKKEFVQLSKETLEKCIKDGLSIRQISSKLNISIGVIQQRAAKYGLKFVRPVKFNKDKYIELSGRGFSDRDISKIMNISESHLRERKRFFGLY